MGQVPRKATRVPCEWRYSKLKVGALQEPSTAAASLWRHSARHRHAQDTLDDYFMASVRAPAIARSEVHSLLAASLVSPQLRSMGRQLTRQR